MKKRKIIKKPIKRFKKTPIRNPKLEVSKFYSLGLEDKVYIGQLKSYNDDDLVLTPVYEVLLDVNQKIILEKQPFYTILINKNIVNGPYATKELALKGITKNF